MKLTLTVSFLDNNRFFVLGMEQVLRGVLHARGYKVTFVYGKPSFGADLIVRAELRTWPSRPCDLQGQPMRYERSVITVREASVSYRPGVPECRAELGVIHRRDSPARVAQLVDRALSREVIPPTDAGCARCAFHLTAREQEILQGIAKGVSPVQMGISLKISQKTVSSHKRAAMRKLGFRRSNELYHWLQEGGLNSVRKKGL